MTKDVLISIRGLQFVQSDTDVEPIEVVTPGEYYKKNGHHYLIFDEMTEGFDEITHNVMKFDESQLEVRKKGLINVQMLFVEDKKTVSYYQTPFGMYQMGIAAMGVELREGPNTLDFQVEYALDINEQYVADCTIHMHVKSKETASLHLGS